MGHLHPSQIELRSVGEVLRRYCQALTATAVQVRSTEELSQRGIGWTAIDQATTEGSTIFLPPALPATDALADGFAAYKVLATHQAGHLEFGTFGFAFERSATLFRNLRLRLAETVGPRSNALTDFERYFDLFRNRRLATDIFTIAEDSRVDFLLSREYRGIRRPYRKAQEKSLARRPALMGLPLRQVWLEVSIRISVGDCGPTYLPGILVPWLRITSGILRRVQDGHATVEDSAEAAVRLYCLLAQVPNMPSSSIPPEMWGTYDLSEPIEVDEDELERLVFRFFSRGEATGREDAGLSFPRPGNLEFRGELKPELAQTLIRLALDQNGADGGASSQVVTAEKLRRLLEKSVEIAANDAARLTSASLAEKLVDESRRAFLSGEIRQKGQPSPGPAGGRRKTPAGDLTEDFYYDEWDYLTSHYKSRWCHLKQRLLEEGSADFFAETLRQHAGLVTAVKKEFEHLKSENFRKVKRLPDGDDLDFDLVVDSLVGKKVGAPFSDRVYWRQKRVERDVCVAFLLDMSASTYERIGSGNGQSTDYGNSSLGVWNGKRIIDLEKEAIIVLVEALEAIGDPYGIYGFSGHSRHNVEFSIIKGISEEFSATIKRRVASISPVRGTRMGPAIRHVANILAQQEAKTKLLILISDGRPQDYDYGEHHAAEDWGGHSYHPKRRSPAGAEITEEMRREYAVFDTRMALLEVRQRRVRPFCLTIDQADHEYLRVMCGEVGYEVLEDIYALPRRLPNLYRRLTTRD